MEFWEKAERWAAKYFDCKVVFGSGRGNLKSDFSSVTTNSKGQEIQLEGGIRGEVKSSVNKKMALQCKWLLKIIKESYKYKQTPVLFIVLGDLSFWYLLPQEDDDITITSYITLNKSISVSSDYFKELLGNNKGLFIPLEVFEENKIPPHLRFNRWIVKSADI